MSRLEFTWEAVCLGAIVFRLVAFSFVRWLFRPR